MAYEEYDYYNEPAGDEKSLKESLREILNGIRSEKNLREAGASLKSALQLTPNVTESLGRGGVAQAIGTSGDLRDLSNMINNYLPKGVRNFTRAAEFLANPYATAIQQTAPTTEQTLDFVPRMSAPYEGYRQHETLGEFVAPSLGYFGAKGAKAYGEYVGPTAYKAVEDYLIKTGGIQQMMAGEKSNHPNYKSKALAEELETKNADPVQIRDATGLIRGPDQKWRTEISDQFSKLKQDPTATDTNFGSLYDAKLRTPGSGGYVHISDVFESPELEKYYPHLFDKNNPNSVTIKLAPEDARYMGRVEDEGRTIAIKPGIDPKDARRILNHEIQHIVQKYEGHATGGSPDTFTQQADAKMARDALSIRREAERMDPNVPWAERVKGSYVLHKGLGMDISDEARIVAENVAANPTKDMQNLTVLYGTDKNIDPYSPIKMYEKIGGEAEARLTENRMDMTDAERAANFPYEYTPRRYDENLQPKPITGLDVRLEDQIIHGHKPNTIDIGGKRIFGTPDQAKPESVEIPKSEPDRLGYNSPLENFINDLKSPKGTGEQFLRQFEKEPSIKADELEMTGIKKFLQENPKVTKEQLQDYIKQNRVQLDEIVKAEAGENSFEDYQLQGGDIYHDDDYISSLADDLYSDMKSDDVIRNQEREALLESDPDRYMDYENNPSAAERLEQDINGSLYEQAKSQAEEMYYENPIREYYDDYGYQIYGNDDNGYTFKSPTGEFLNIGGRNGTYNLTDAEVNLREHLFDQGVIDMAGDGARHESHSLPGKYDNYREVLVTLPDQYKKGSKDWVYESHYDEPNILGHIRLDDRTIDGKKTLFVEEVQSDWHQHGRDEGYATPESDAKKTELLGQIHDVEKKLYAEKQEKRDLIKNDYSEGMIEDQDKLIAKVQNELDALEEAYKKLGKVPDAPYKKNWHELLMKKVLDIAAKEDYDAVAFTTGSQQNARWSLSKHIDSLDLMPAKEGDKQFVLQGWKDGRNIIRKAVNEDELPNYIGIEAAKKLLAQEPKGLHRPEGIAHGNPNVFEGRELSGLELEMGGEPMKKFYDRDIPSFINKYGKKYGISMKKANLPYRGVPSADDVYANAQKYGYSKEQFDRLPPDEQKKIRNEVMPKGEEVHLFDMPEKAKKDIKDYGQPLFSGIGLAAGTDYLLGANDQQKTGILADLMKQKY